MSNVPVLDEDDPRKGTANKITLTRKPGGLFFDILIEFPEGEPVLLADVDNLETYAIGVHATDLGYEGEVVSDEVFVFHLPTVESAAA